MKNIFNYISNLLFPQKLKCIVCKNELCNSNNMYLCKNCFNNVFYIKNPCPTCGDEMFNGNTYCLNCKNRAVTYFKFNRSVFVYNNVAKNLITRAKFRGEKYLVAFLFDELYKLYINLNLSIDLITYVHSKTNKDRFYNIPELLAKKLSDKTAIPLVKTLECIKTDEQKNKDFTSRQINVKNAFKFINCDVKYKNILLIDDIYTTGATINECSKLLKTHGAQTIYALTLAHTLKK